MCIKNWAVFAHHEFIYVVALWLLLRKRFDIVFIKLGCSSSRTWKLWKTSCDGLRASDFKTTFVRKLKSFNSSKHRAQATAAAAAAAAPNYQCRKIWIELLLSNEDPWFHQEAIPEELSLSGKYEEPEVNRTLQEVWNKEVFVNLAVSNAHTMNSKML